MTEPVQSKNHSIKSSNFGNISLKISCQKCQGLRYFGEHFVKSNFRPNLAVFFFFFATVHN